jgi:hypothetical protein
MIQDTSTLIWYHLPTAEYYRETNLARSEILEDKKAAARTINKKFYGYRYLIEWYKLA